MGTAAAWALFKRFWFVIPLVALAFVVLFQRNTITGRTAERNAAQARVKDVSEANKSLEGTIRIMAAARIDNDAIAEAVAKRVGATNMRLVETRTVIERATRNDPATRTWGAVPVPSSVREALRPRPQPTDAP